MVGRALEDTQAPEQQGASARSVLRLGRLSLPGAFDDVSLDVGAGEIVGLAGLVGAGRSELLEAVFGLRQASGVVAVEGQEVALRSPRQAMRAGIGFVPADRKLQGLVLTMTVRENLMMASTARRSRLRYPSPRLELDAVRRTIADLDIRARSPRVLVSTLSGGNQQKVVLGKWLTTDPKVLLLDEPTRGVDVGAKAEIYRLLFEASERGIAILLSSSETPELQTLCDRILVIFRGRVAASLTREEASEARIAHFAGGHQ